MAHILTAVSGSAVDTVPVRRALLSVSDKTGLAAFATALMATPMSRICCTVMPVIARFARRRCVTTHSRRRVPCVLPAVQHREFGVHLLSTGGTAKALRDAGLPVEDVSSATGFPEVMDGRVKTLHPKIHGGLLAVRGNPQHEAEMSAHGIPEISLVCVNLYAFSATVESGASFDTCIENIDIGGPSMLRSAAKNNAAVTVVSSPSQYEAVLAEMRAHAAEDAATHQRVGYTTLATRRKLAAAAFAHTASYDSAISTWFAGQVTAGGAEAVHTRQYVREVALKYGCNPHQSPAFVGRLLGGEMPFTVLNGTPGYINLLDAANAWQLARELRNATGLAAAASFKHVSPAGAAVAVPLSPELVSVYEAGDKPLTPVALAYLRARNADPMCSFGDFAAVSDIVDEATALLLKPEVSDGIVAPGFTPEALDILKTKKSGGFIILQSKAAYEAPSMEFREVFGMMFAQRRNDARVTADAVTKDVRTAAKELTPEAIRDLIVALVSIKYTQSNSVGYAVDGQMIGVGAGQQSRVDCVKLAGRKVATWWLRHHPKVKALKFKPSVKRQGRVNARVRYIEGDFTPVEYAEWVQQFEEEPAPLTDAEKTEWLRSLKGVSLASDAFFPFRDSLDHAAKYGVTYVSQPGGSVQDEDVIKAANEYGMIMGFSGLRLFHH